MNLVLQLMQGITLAGLAEGMALADRAGLQQKDVLEILGLTSLSCPALVDKGNCKLLLLNLISPVDSVTFRKTRALRGRIAKFERQKM